KVVFTIGLILVAQGISFFIPGYMLYRKTGNEYSFNKFKEFFPDVLYHEVEEIDQNISKYFLEVKWLAAPTTRVMLYLIKIVSYIGFIITVIEFSIFVLTSFDGSEKNVKFTFYEIEEKIYKTKK
ncbi:MAG: hypothetical protein MHPSP_001844, partial [Paramarteilia canceri]